MGSPQTVTAGTLFGNVTADLFAPTVTLPSVVDATEAARVLVPTDGAEPVTTVADEPPVLSPASSLSQPQPVQPTLQRQRDTRIELSDLRNPGLKRPPALLPLYVTFATLQMLDAHSTTRALGNGGVEGNPIVALVTGNSGALYATKIAATAATIYLGERLWRENRFAAIIAMVAVNSGYAFIVRHNYGIASR